MTKRIFISMACVLLFGCAGTRDTEQADRTKMEYDSFQHIEDSCLNNLNSYVEQKYGRNYTYKNAIKSREPHYIEAVYINMNSYDKDSVVIVKIDSSCTISRSYKTMMSITEKYKGY
jgi:hypothetical protein